MAEPYISMVTPTPNLKKVRLMGYNRIHLWIHSDFERVHQMTLYIYGFSLMENNGVGVGEHQMAENHVYSWIHIYLAETLSNEI
jgi:hypothetical protein